MGAIWSVVTSAQVAGGDFDDHEHRLDIGDIINVRARAKGPKRFALRVTGRHGDIVHTERI